MHSKIFFLLFFSILCLPSMSQTTSKGGESSSINTFLFHQVDSLRRQYEENDRKLHRYFYQFYDLEEAIKFLSFLQQVEIGNKSATLDRSGSYIVTKDGKIDSGNIDINYNYLIALRLTTNSDWESSDSLVLKKLFSNYPKLWTAIISGRVVISKVGAEPPTEASAPQLILPTATQKKISNFKLRQLKEQIEQILAFKSKSCNTQLISKYFEYERKKNFSIDQQLNNREFLIQALKKQCKD